MIKYRGDFSFKRQVGATGPTPDLVYNLSYRQETWQGTRADLAAFQAAVPLGSVHPDFPDLNLAVFDPRFLEAGIVDVSLRYCGRGETEVVTKKRPSLLKTGTAAIKIVRSFERVVQETTSTTGAITSQIWGPVVQETEGEMVYQFHTPSITYSYCRNSEVTSAQKATLATADLAGLTPQIQVISRRQTGTTWTMRSGYQTPSDLSVATVRNMVTTYELANGTTLGTANLRAADVNCDPEGQSGWFKIDETWEVELV